ncbi:MAG TPA: DUF4139 domain-containing protein, partial [Polyangia bacterium]
MEQSKGTALAVTRAVLYQNGIGYFERRGKLDGDLLKLRVRPDQIRDVLKSLTVVDLSSGRAISIALPIEKSRLKQLSELPEQVRAQGGVLAIAQAFRGARCQVEGERSATGRLVGVENLGSETKPDWRLSVLTADNVLTQFSVTKVRALKILDGTLELGLRKALDVALDAGSWKPVELAVRLSGPAPHELVVSYVVEMPTWKPAYRVVLGPSENGKPGKALLQGWAVVDNVSGDDWKGIRLSLTAGTPLAFTYDLYTPRFPVRPNLEPQDQAAQIPLDAYQAEGGIAAQKSATATLMAGGGRRGGPGAPPAAPMASAAPEEADKSARAAEPAPPPEPAPVDADALQRNYQALVAGSTVGSLFRYDLDQPITVDDRQSALVNIVNTKVPGEEVLLYRVGQDGASPYRAVRFTNDTGFVLESGPIAIYHQDAQGGTFLGEALGGRIEKTATTFVPYALDGRVRVTLDEAQNEKGMTLVKIVRGLITAESKRVTRYSYDVDNGSGEATTLWVRRPRRTGWKVVGADQMIEEGGAYFIPIALPAAGRTKVSVEEQSPVERSVDIWSDLGRQVIGLYLTNSS